MTVKELRAALEGVADDLEIVVRAFDDDNDYCGTISGVEIQYAHDGDDTRYLAIDCGPDADPEDGCNAT